MKLPNIQQPLFDIVIPSTKEKVMFRPYLVKEEKLLLIAQQSDDEMDIIRAIRQVVNACIQKEGFPNQNLTTFDLEYLFLKIRSKSVNNIVELAYRDNEDDEIYKFKIDLDEIEVTFPENINNKIKISDDVGMVMKYPSSDITNNVKEFDSDVELMLFFVANCIESIYDKENVYAAEDYSAEDLEEFTNSLDVKSFTKLKEFFDNIPKLYHKIEYTNKKGNKRVIELKNIKDFFTLR